MAFEGIFIPFIQKRLKNDWYEDLSFEEKSQKELEKYYC